MTTINDLQNEINNLEAQSFACNKAIITNTHLMRRFNRMAAEKKKELRQMERSLKHEAKTA